MNESNNNGANNKIIAIIIGSLVAITPFLMGIFVVFIAVFFVLGLFETGNSGGGGSGIVDANEQITISSSGSYWWPIGGSEVEVKNGVKYATGKPVDYVISDYFSGSRSLNGNPHRGIDIASSINPTYIIPAKDGKVYRAYDGCETKGYYNTQTNQCNQCGYSYGNHIIIEHADGNYTVYAHMAKNTLTVKTGDTVKQGQIIGEMGSSGCSTGTHLHFGIFVGAYSNDKAVDPLTYFDLNNPRPSSKASSKLLSMLKILEGTTRIDGDYYVAEQGSLDAPGIITVGHGVTVSNNIEAFKARGYSDPTKDIVAGTRVPISIADEIAEEVLFEEHRNKIVNKLKNRNITLTDYQIDALTSRSYNLGPGTIDNFFKYYEQYGITQALYDNYMSTGVYSPGSGGKPALGLVRRREREWKLFTEGLYYGVDYT